MDQVYDVLIVGGGSAATSAAMTLRNRGKSIAVVTNRPETSSLYKAEKITNYPGLPPMTGAEMSALFRKQLEDTGATIIEGRTISVLPMEDSFGVAVGSDYYMARSIIITAGITREKLYPGEAEYLGRGVSYCATCDGMLYRGKTVAVVGGGEEAKQDADFLEGIGCRVLRFEKNGKYEISGGMKAVRFPSPSWFPASPTKTAASSSTGTWLRRFRAYLLPVTAPESLCSWRRQSVRATLRRSPPVTGWTGNKPVCVQSAENPA